MTKKRKISYAELAGGAVPPAAPGKSPAAGGQPDVKAAAAEQKPVTVKPDDAQPSAEQASAAKPSAAKPKRATKPRAPKKAAAEAPAPLPPPVKAPEVVPGIAMKPRVSSPVEIAAVLRTSPAKGIPAYTGPVAPPAPVTPTPEAPPAAAAAAAAAPVLPSAPAVADRRQPAAGSSPSSLAGLSVDDYAAALARRLAAMAPVEIEEEETVVDTRPLRDRIRAREGLADLLMFRIGPEIFATELAAVEEAVSLPAIHHLPEMPAAMLGAFNLRGRLTPVYSPAHVIGVPLAGAAQAALLVRSNGKRFGLAVDDVEDVFQVDLATVREAPGIDDADGILLGVAHHGQDLVAVLDAEALVAACLTGHVMETA